MQIRIRDEDLAWQKLEEQGQNLDLPSPKMVDYAEKHLKIIISATSKNTIIY